ncbi:hypothetical protein [Carnobacterium divergens]|uniref:hypothetical protein n=1 Tax=Carnobacterium divergens TaxID=2748 RepID=UPI0039B06688
MKKKEIEELEKELNDLFSDIQVISPNDFIDNGSMLNFEMDGGRVIEYSQIGQVAIIKIASILFNQTWFNRNFTYKELEDKILQFGANNYLNIHCARLFKLEEYLKSFVVEEVEHKVISILGGIGNCEKELNFGDFKIYSSDNIRSYLKYNGTITDDFLKNFKNKMLIETSVFSSNKKRAEEIANERIENFINIITFFIFSKTMKYQIYLGLSNLNVLNSSLVNYENNLFRMNNRKGPLFDIDLKKYSESNDKKLNRVFEIEKKIWSNQANDIEKRIYNSIQWAGRALNERFNDKKFVQAMFGMEALLQEKNKNSVISPSITYQMSEVLIFCLGKNYDEKIKIEKNFKQLYTTRSNIAHGERTQVSEYESNLVLDYLRHIINYFLENDLFETFSNVKEFIEREKYNKS